MVKNAIAIALILSMCSCSLFTPPALGDKDFPLVQSFTFPVNGEIRGIAVNDKWLAYHTTKEITAIDINTQELLWQMEFPTISSDDGFQMINDRLIASSRNQIISLDMQGQREDLLILEPGDYSSEYILDVSDIYQNYAYLILGPLWTLEVYDTSKKVVLWKADIIQDAFYVSSTNIVYVITRGGEIQALDNSNGALLWQYSGNVVHSAYSAGVLFLSEHIKSDGHYDLLAFDVKNKEELWRKTFTETSENEVYKLTTIGRYLIVGTQSGLLAFDINNGTQVWEINVEEPIETSPVEFNGVIYAKGVYTSTIYALSLPDGSLIGVADLQKEGFSITADIYTGVYEFSEGIVFSTKDSIFIYKFK